jgi:hypothetical protein
VLCGGCGVCCVEGVEGVEGVEVRCGAEVRDDEAHRYVS